jgi:hypothetical protein
MTYSKEYLDKVAKAHRKFGFSWRNRTENGKQYIKIETRYVEADRRGVRDSDWLSSHMKKLFPKCYITSGCYGFKTAELTFRINP